MLEFYLFYETKSPPSVTKLLSNVVWEQQRTIKKIKCIVFSDMDFGWSAESKNPMTDSVKGFLLLSEY